MKRQSPVQRRVVRRLCGFFFLLTSDSCLLPPALSASFGLRMASFWVRFLGPHPVFSTIWRLRFAIFDISFLPFYSSPNLEATATHWGARVQTLLLVTQIRHSTLRSLHSAEAARAAQSRRRRGGSPWVCDLKLAQWSPGAQTSDDVADLFAAVSAPDRARVGPPASVLLPRRPSVFLNPSSTIRNSSLSRKLQKLSPMSFRAKPFGCHSERREESRGE